VRSLRLSPPPASIAFPTFSHELKDPQPAAEPITPAHRIVVVEGLYAFVDDPDEPAWAQAAGMLDLRVWVDVDEDVARGRIAARNFASGIEPTLEATIKRGSETEGRRTGTSLGSKAN
jgi:pantothenate kinase